MNEAGQFVPAGSWLDIIFNPSFPYRLVHTVLAAYLTTALVVGGVGAWHLLRGRAHARGPHHVLDGDVDGGAGRAGADLRRRPARAQHLRAPAGQDHGDGGPFPEPSRRRAALSCSAFPTRRRRPCASPVAIPQLGSLLLEHDPERAACAGLDTVPLRGPAAGRRSSSGRSGSWSALGFLMFGARPLEPARAAARASSTTGAGCTASRWSWGRRASSR